MTESLAQKKLRALTIIKTLEKTYPDAKCALHFKGVFQLLVAVILSAQCTDKQVNKITPLLFKMLPDAKAFANAPLGKIEMLIRSTGFYRNKAKNIQGAAKKILENFQGKVPQTMKELLTLPGVARKTANVILETGFEKVEGITVDTHVNRITVKRLQIVPKKLLGKAEKVEQELQKVLPRSKWGNFSHLIIAHGRSLCTARSPRCTECPVAGWCWGREI